VSKGFPIVFVAGPGDVPLIISGVNEVKVRGARTIVIAEDDPRLRANAQDVIVLPKSDAQISALLGVLPLQMLSYHMSVCAARPRFPEEPLEDAHGRLRARQPSSFGSQASPGRRRCPGCRRF
jgi:glucosamine 6-phosphate synthetase-like amidotransferase/phosphosugar isomerase protein